MFIMGPKQNAGYTELHDVCPRTLLIGRLMVIPRLVAVVRRLTTQEARGSGTRREAYASEGRGSLSDGESGISFLIWFVYCRPWSLRVTRCRSRRSCLLESQPCRCRARLTRSRMPLVQQARTAADGRCVPACCANGSEIVVRGLLCSRPPISDRSPSCCGISPYGGGV